MRNPIQTIELVAQTIAEDFPTASILLLQAVNEIEPTLARVSNDNADRLVLAQHWES